MKRFDDKVIRIKRYELLRFIASVITLAYKSRVIYGDENRSIVGEIRVIPMETIICMSANIFFPASSG